MNDRCLRRMGGTNEKRSVNNCGEDKGKEEKEVKWCWSCANNNVIGSLIAYSIHPLRQPYNLRKPG